MTWYHESVNLLGPSIILSLSLRFAPASVFRRHALESLHMAWHDSIASIGRKYCSSPKVALLCLVLTECCVVSTSIMEIYTYTWMSTSVLRTVYLIESMITN
jgi:hypothetical protein